MTAPTFRRFMILVALCSVPALTGVGGSCENPDRTLNDGGSNQRIPVSTGAEEATGGLLNATLLLEEDAVALAGASSAPADASPTLNGATEEPDAPGIGDPSAPAAGLLNEDLNRGE